MTARSEPDWDLIVALKAAQRGLITPAQLAQAREELARQKASGAAESQPLSQILVTRGFLNVKVWAALVEETRGEEEGGTTSRRIRKLPESVGPYRILREVGRGGTGVVFEALHGSIGQRAALKILLSDEGEPSSGQRAHEMALFAKEALTLAKLPPHPNIVRVYDAGLSNHQAYIATEYIDGQSMSDWLSKTEPSLRDAVRTLRDVALAVHHAHEGGILHRDLNPRNVLVDRTGRPFVTDFGHARRMSVDHKASSTSDGMIVGTPAYMSPEQARGLKTIDRRADVYSLGAMLYEILAGRPPFSGDMSIVTLLSIIHDPVPPLPGPSSGRHAAGSEEFLKSVCMKALSKDPSQRHPSALEFSQALSSWLEGNHPPASSDASGSKAWGRSIPWKAVALLLGLLAGLGGLLFLGLKLRGRLGP